MGLKLYAVKTGEVKAGDNIIQVVLGALKRQNLELEDNDILAFA